VRKGWRGRLALKSRVGARGGAGARSGYLLGAPVCVVCAYTCACASSMLVLLCCMLVAAETSPHVCLAGRSDTKRGSVQGTACALLAALALSMRAPLIVSASFSP